MGKEIIESMSVIQAAKELKLTIREVKNLLKNNQLESIDVEDEPAHVSVRSVKAVLGEEYQDIDQYEEGDKEAETIPLHEAKIDDIESEDDPAKTNNKGDPAEKVGLSFKEVMGIVLPQIEELAEDMEEMLQRGDIQIFTKKDMKEVVDVAYMKGKLAVYESMESFERRTV